MTTQTFGDRINLYLHFLVTEGGTDEAGVFHKIPRIDDLRLGEESEGFCPHRLFRRRFPELLTPPGGRPYTTGMDGRVESS
jgi:hypothetical protein